MTERRRTALIDPGTQLAIPRVLEPRAGEVVRLIQDGGEYVTAIERTADRPAWRGLPDTVFLDLYAYELLERIREREARRGAGAPGDPESGTETWIVPLWPACLYVAAGAEAHAGREIAALYPRLDAIGVRLGDAAAIEAAARRVLGRVPFDPAAYRRVLRETASASGWIILPEAGLDSRTDRGP